MSDNTIYKIEMKFMSFWKQSCNFCALIPELEQVVLKCVCVYERLNWVLPEITKSPKCQILANKIALFLAKLTQIWQFDCTLRRSFQIA